jgi:hypothetical protein
MRYRVKFTDGSRAKVKAETKAEAKHRAEKKHKKTVSKVREYGEEA